MTENQIHSTLCPKIEQAFTLLGKKWAGLIILILTHEPQRFCQIAKQINISEKVLSQRLKDLEKDEIITRQVITGNPSYIAYALTKKGQAMQPIIQEITIWAEKWSL